jgi:hypothetical protein
LHLRRAASGDNWEGTMRLRDSIAAILLGAALLIPAGAKADDSKYPNLNGQWRRAGNAGLLAGGAGGLRYDDSLPIANTPSLGQKPPLTAEYQAIYDANLADMVQGGQGIDPTYACISPGMPRVMIPYGPIEMVVTPEITYVLFERDHDHFRYIYTDGRDFPANMQDQPMFLGYSIGHWVDTQGTGHYDTLEVETRGLKGPRVFDATGIPLHDDNDTIVTERFHLDKGNPNLLHVDITTFDHALTRPWTVSRLLRRFVSDKPVWFGHSVCGEGNEHVGIGKEVYFLSADGMLMPAKKDQPPPDLRYFKKYGQ